MTKTLLRAGLLLAPLAFVFPQSVDAQALPEARALIARYIEVSGAAKLADVPGMRTKGTFDLAAVGISGALEAIQSKDGRSVTTINIPGVGEVKQGTELDFAWAMDPFQGPRVIEGAEFAQLKEQQNPKAQLRDAAFVTSATSIERTTMDGQPCVKVKLQWKSGRESTECYSEQTGFLVASEGVQKSPMGDIPTSTFYREYKDIGYGVMSATKVVQQIMGQEQVLSFTSLIVEAIPPEAFVVPAEVKALRK
jgi:hypothetical protein